MNKFTTEQLLDLLTESEKIQTGIYFNAITYPGHFIILYGGITGKVTLAQMRPVSGHVFETITIWTRDPERVKERGSGLTDAV